MDNFEKADQPSLLNIWMKSYHDLIPSFKIIALATIAIIKIQIPMIYNRIIKIV